MTNEIKVYVVEFSDRKHYQMQYRCPGDNKLKTRSTKVEITGRKRERDAAERKAGDWEKELRAGNYQPPSKATWETLRTRYENEIAAHQAANTERAAVAAFDRYEAFANPQRAADVTTEAVSRYAAHMQSKGLAVMTVAALVRPLRTLLNWGREIGLLKVAPKIRVPSAQGEKWMKGRPICGEEHDRIKAAVVKTMKPHRRAAWLFLLEGLWTSGFRLSEALALSWEPTAKVTAVVIPGSRPVVRFMASGQKGRRNEIWPCPPEFAALLESVPEAERVGKVFEMGISQDRVSRRVAAFAKRANVVVDETSGRHCTAHDYRRAFGTRWAKRVMPAVLKILMRHRDLKTTMRFYVDIDANQLADELFKQFGVAPNTAPNSEPKTTQKAL